MKTFIQISADGTRAHWKFQSEERPEFAPEIILVEVTDLQPQPQEGWLWDGQNFSPPPAPPLAELINRLQIKLHAYIDAHYDQGTQAMLTAVFADPATPQAAKDQILLAWSWVKQVLVYYYGLKAQLVAGQPWESLSFNFPQFDATDPQVSLQSILE